MIADVARAYATRSSLAAAWTSDRDDTARDAWAALDALLTDGSVHGATLADALYFRAMEGADTYRIGLDNAGRSTGVEVAS